jgi:hypothetical protein
MQRNELKGQEAAEILSRFGKTKAAAIKRYRLFINDGVATGRRNNLVGIGLLQTGEPFDEEIRNSRVLGSGILSGEFFSRPKSHVAHNTNLSTRSWKEF